MLFVVSINIPNLANWILSICTQFDYGYLASVWDIVAMENVTCTVMVRGFRLIEYGIKV